jgi:hypothetical protein
MKTIKQLDDLRAYGINPLTGEACRLGRRILCDLTANGLEIVRDLLGIGPTYSVAPNWNSGAIACFMMPYSLIEDTAVWCLIHSGCREVAVVKEQVIDGLRAEWSVFGKENGADSEWDRILVGYREMGVQFRRITVKSCPGSGTRCEHMMSGRTT